MTESGTQFLAPELAAEEDELDRSLRPKSLAAFVGQDRIKEQLGIALEGESIRAIADAFSQLSADTREIADALAVPAADEQDAAAKKRAG